MSILIYFLGNFSADEISYIVQEGYVNNLRIKIKLNLTVLVYDDCNYSPQAREILIDDEIWTMILKTSFLKLPF